MVEIKQSNSKGKGVFAVTYFEKNDTVLIGVIEKELCNNNSHASQVGLNRFVLHNELVRLVNHSCNPNCGIKVNATGAHDFVAKRNIIIGDEITYDYAMRNYTIQHFPSQCNCGTEQCRGKITGWKDLPNDTKDAYLSWAAPYLFELDKKRGISNYI